MTRSLEDPVSTLDGVGPRRAGELKRAFEIRTVRDLLEHYPRRYQDLGALMDLTQVSVGEPATLVGTIRSWESFRPKGKRKLLISKATVVGDAGGQFTATFFNQEWRQRQLRPGTLVALSGTVERFRSELQLKMPEVQTLGDGDPGELDHKRLLPVYRASEKLPSWRIARWIEEALDELPPVADHLPEDLLDRHDLLALDDAIRWIHQPPDRPTAKAARKRLVFDELFLLQLGLHWRRMRLEADLAGLDNAPIEGGHADQFLAELPFDPTDAQVRAFAEIGADLGGERPMHRLLQGDVGAGKTIVAVWTVLAAIDRGRQAALMVPTEVLAEQHFHTLTELLAPLGVNVLDGLRVELLTSSTTTEQRRRILGELLSGRVDLVVGTHALLEEGVRFHDLGGVVIDEQHRFGVSQRVQLREKRSGGGNDSMPDVLVMTATPIPRSLALTMYGDLDVTVLDELPPGRTPVVTQVITPNEKARRDTLYDFVRQQAGEGLQTYVVCPLVEESEEIAARAATVEHDRLATEIWPDLTVELVHGRMRADEKDAAMGRFRRGEADVLVATTVIEVGVDVPKATVMIIEDAERFGISQLHQLRGRVGRGADRSYCVLFAGWHNELTDEAVERLTAIGSTTDGFELAEKDLEIRGEGQLFGQRQSGMPDLKLARLQRDTKLIGLCRDTARSWLEQDPELERSPDLRSELFRRYEGGLDEFAALQTG